MSEKCKNCDGFGMIEYIRLNGELSIKKTDVNPYEQYSERVVKICQRCNGTGYTLEDE